ncbi:Ppx/GppA phosphatase family protein [Methanomassiliicoccus luminyensis]|uniref:Ppx/GppA phosphatase family protein n=1 Tax=Methanomassiliicoccus luminyensis TaxID=1080712 RepID=UPI00037F4681|nr:Ppx/GppA phosphatase family protein [Methanomassiliicoccus luminyensis]
MMQSVPRADHVVSFLDIGTNSVRMLVVRLNPNFSYTVLSQQKEVVRLGENEFIDHTLRRDAMDRTVHVCRKFAELSRTYGADEIIAVATSAAREAKNQAVLVERLHDEAGIDMGIISGVEEARLVYLGVSSAVELTDRTALFVDLGGGSTELAIGTQENYSYLDSLKLGAIRITGMYVEEGDREGPVDDSVYNKMRKHVRGLLVHSAHSISLSKVDMAIGSSGTVMNLADIASRTCGGKVNSLKLAHLKKVSAMLRSLPLAERRKVPGLNPERADIIVGGAAILETIMEELKIDELVVSDRGVRDGLLVDYLSKIEGYPHAGRMSVRETSVLQLGRSCNIDEPHAETVVRLALALFDSAKQAGLHSLGDKEREVLKYAAYLHDVGDFISFTNHQAHSYYIVRNADLLGFDEREIAIMANLTRYHRKKVPKKKDPEMEGLDLRAQQVIITLSAFLRLAEELDRSHTGLMRSVALKKEGKDTVLLEGAAAGDASLEIWGVESDAKAFKRAFDRDLRVDIIRVP